MTNVLIRKLINHGYTPEMASNACIVYLCNYSLADLESKISMM